MPSRAGNGRIGDPIVPDRRVWFAPGAAPRGGRPREIVAAQDTGGPPGRVEDQELARSRCGELVGEVLGAVAVGQYRLRADRLGRPLGG